MKHTFPFEHRNLILPLEHFDQTVLMKYSAMFGRELSILKSVTKEYSLVEATKVEKNSYIPGMSSGWLQ